MSVTELLRNNETRCFDPIRFHCYAEDTKELLDAIRSNESVVDFLLDPFVPSCNTPEQHNYLNWCYDLLDACSRFRGLRRAFMNTSHFPLSIERLCCFIRQARHLEHLSLGSLFNRTLQSDKNHVCWLDGSVAPLLQTLRKHPNLNCFELHLPDSKSDASRFLLTQLHTLSNLHELRVSLGTAACPDDSKKDCWMGPLLLQMPHSIKRLSFCNVGDSDSTDFATALQDNTSLEELCLIDSHFNETTWRGLAQALQTNTQLQILSIRNGNIDSDQFLAYLAQSLKQNPYTQLRVLHLALSEASADTNSILLDLLQTNTSLQRIQVEGQERNESIDLYLKLNRAGRSQWWSNPEACWDCMLHRDLDCIYAMLQENPTLCSRCSF